MRNKRNAIVGIFLIQIFIFVACIVLFGCSQPLRTLMDLGAEQGTQGSFVRQQNLKFELLMKETKQGKLKKGLTRQFIERRYGPPVLVMSAPSRMKQETETKTIFLYRNPVEYFDTPKAYLDFDANDILVNVRIEEGHAQ